ncbi:MAG: head-tail connector protein [Hyphomicrobiales bacterium]
MAAVLVAPPAAEPVSLAEVKEHLRVDGPDEEPLIVALITTARLTIEHLAGLALMTQTWAVLLDEWPDGRVVELPVAPVASIDAVRVYDAADAADVIDPAEYFADLASRPARLVRRGRQGWPAPGRVANGTEIELTAGFGATPEDVPETLRWALLMLVGHWFENRAAVEADTQLRHVPLAVQAVLGPYRKVRL